MKYVRPAGIAAERNLVLLQQGEDLIFVACRNISPRQELRVSYDPEYARERGLPVPEPFEEGNLIA